MRYFLIVFSLFFLSSCFSFSGRIFLQNNTTSHLLIETNPIIASATGGWENGIHFYNRDSIIWTYTLGNNIKARIIQPNGWKGKDSTFVLSQPSGSHYSGYGLYKFDSTQNGIYSMYPNSSFTIGDFNTRKKSIPLKDELNGRFSIHKLIIYRSKDTLVATGDKEIWNLLLSLDRNKRNFDKNGQRKKIRDWIVYVGE